MSSPRFPLHPITSRPNAHFSPLLTHSLRLIVASQSILHHSSSRTFNSRINLPLLFFKLHCKSHWASSSHDLRHPLLHCIHPGYFLQGFKCTYPSSSSRLYAYFNCIHPSVLPFPHRWPRLILRIDFFSHTSAIHQFSTHFNLSWSSFGYMYEHFSSFFSIFTWILDSKFNLMLAIVSPVRILIKPPKASSVSKLGGYFYFGTPCQPFSLRNTQPCMCLLCPTPRQLFVICVQGISEPCYS